MVENIPTISVVMPVYNSDNYLEESINSILNQTFKNFEFIIVCSEPTEKTRKILEKYQCFDSRVLVFYQERKGIIFARNFGCKQAKGEFIAVMDADDISYPKRFETQLLFMEKHPDIGIIGSWTDFIDEDGVVTDTFRCPTNPLVIGWYLIFENYMMHLTILIRTNILEELHYYTLETKGFPEDYDLWTRAVFFTKIANLPISLTQHRLHSTSNTINVKPEMAQFFNIIRNTMLQKLSEREFQNFLKETGFRMNSDVLTFNINYNDKQIKFIENLYRSYVYRFKVTPEDLIKIRSCLALNLLRYSYSMFSYSKTRSVVLFYKSFHYSNSILIKIIIRSLRKRFRHLLLNLASNQQFKKEIVLGR